MTISDLSTLTADGDTVTLDDGRTLRLRIEPENDPVMDRWLDECYGAIAWADDDRRDDYGRPRNRPDGFDGNAEKLHFGRSYDSVWWQPPEGLARGTDAFTAQRRQVIDLLEYGFVSVGLEILDGIDAYSRPIVVGVAWIGGIEPGYPDYLADDILPELFAEVAE